MPSICAADWTRGSISRFFSPWSLSPNAMFSYTVMCGYSA